MIGAASRMVLRARVPKSCDHRLPKLECRVLRHSEERRGYANTHHIYTCTDKARYSRVHATSITMPVPPLPSTICVGLQSPPTYNVPNIMSCIRSTSPPTPELDKFSLAHQRSPRSSHQPNPP
ncbi:hypothetical protein BDQ17DRAFT_747621 [Cyathus striatus]|nr:hypothetical protein BDQ17DRAFT_747621 [Cyathus striatus]